MLDVIRKMNLKGKKPLEKMPEAQEGKKLKAEFKADEVLKDAEKPRRANEGRGRKEAPRQEAPAKDAPKADPKPKAEVKAEAQTVMKAEVAASTRRSDKNKNETKEKENNKNRREVKEAPLLEAGKGPVKELEAPAAKEVKEIAKEAPKEAPRETAKDAAKEAPKDVKEAPKQETTAKETKGKNGKRDEAPAFTEKDFIDRLTDTASRAGLLYNQKDLINFHMSVKSSRLVILAGMSGTGKSGLVRLYGKALGIPEERICFLPVRPSWMDDGDILGYVDMKNLVYRSADTGLAELLIDASQHTDKLYIVCFDEMNLARAEPYFAQFISALAKEGNPDAVSFPKAHIEGAEYDFSFSGLKSAVLNYVNKMKMTGGEIVPEDIAASFQYSVVDVLVTKTMKAAKEKGAGTADDMEAKLAGRDPEKAAKVRAAMEAKAAREAAKKEQADSAAKPAATDQKEGE